MAAKVCVACGKELGMFSVKIALLDGVICEDCWKKIGYTTKKKDIEKAATYSSKEIREIAFGYVENPIKKFERLQPKIVNLIKESGTGLFMSTEKENIKLAIEMLHSEEKIVAAISANVSFGEPEGALKQSVFNLKNKTSGIVVLTDQRILFASNNGRYVTKSIYLTDVNAIDDLQSFFSGGTVLRIQSTSTSLAIDGTTKTIPPFRNKIDEAVHSARANNSQNNNVIVQQQNSDADEILKYKNLFDAGIITEEEFQAKKKQLLGL